MPKATEHLEMANRTQETIRHLLLDVNLHAPWIATTAFYKALHVVEAVFENDPSIRHTTDHDKRGQELKRQNKYKNIAIHYGALQRASQIARYATLGEFFRQFPGEKVVEQLLKHRLKQFELSAKKFLAKPDDLVSFEDI